MNAAGKTISVIIPCFNAQSTLERCVRSVVATGYPSLEIILVDDLSTDASPKTMKTLAAAYLHVVRVLRLDVNGGPARARNRGAATATGDYLFFVDSDTEMLPDALAAFAARIDEADAVVGTYHYEPLNEGLAPRYKALLNFYFFSRLGTIPYEVFDASRAGIRAEVFRSVGGFNETLRSGMDYENEEFGYRLHQTHRMLLDPRIQVRHHFPSAGKLTRTYFVRVALWMEIFLRRRRFESGGVTTAGTGVGTAALLVACLCLGAGAFTPAAAWLALPFFLVYLVSYVGFFRFVARRRPTFLPFALALNVYFTLVLGAAAAFGALRVLTRASDIAKSPAFTK